MQVVLLQALKKSQACCFPSVNQSTCTMTEVTGEFVDDLMRIYSLRRTKGWTIPECFVDDANMSFCYHLTIS